MRQQRLHTHALQGIHAGERRLIFQDRDARRIGNHIRGVAVLTGDDQRGIDKFES
jgi:hypothetical protein